MTTPASIKPLTLTPDHWLHLFSRFYPKEKSQGYTYMALYDFTMGKFRENGTPFNGYVTRVRVTLKTGDPTYTSEYTLRTEVWNGSDGRWNEVINLPYEMSMFAGENVPKDPKSAEVVFRTMDESLRYLTELVLGV